MTPQQGVRTIKEAVGVFEDAASFEAAVDELRSSGFDRAELSLLADEETVRKKLGHMYTKVSEVENDAEVPRSAYVSTESIGDAEGGVIGGLLYVGAVAAAGAVVATGGTLAAAIVAAVLSGSVGVAIGTVLASFIGKHHADYLQAQMDHGGILLWVHLRDDEHQSRALDILSKHSAHDIHVHEYPA